MGIIRRAYEGFRTMDRTAILEALDPEVELDASEAMLSTGVYHGHDGVREYIALLAEKWGDFHIDALEFSDSVGGYAMVCGRLRGVDRSTGDRVEAPWTHVLRVRGGKVARVQIFVDRDKAQRAMETAVREVVAD